MTPIGKKLTLFMFEGSAVGPVCIDVGNWSGRAIYCPRSSAIEIIKREEFSKPGVYILKTDNTEKNTSSERIYIGEAEVIRDRIKQHLSDSKKEFFSEFIAFFSKDELLTKAHIKYLEAMLIEGAKEVNTAELENKNHPDKCFLSEADESVMEYFYSLIELILPVVNFRFLVRSTIKDIPKKSKDSNAIKTYFLKSKTQTAVMEESSSGFVLKEGATASVKTQKSLSKGWLKIREALIEREVLIFNKEKNRYILTKDTIFTSPSSAASVLLGRQTPGPLHWQNKNGTLLKDLLAEELNKNGN